MSSGAERAHFLVRTLSGASYRFNAGSSTNYIRQRIAAKSVEAQALNLKEEDVRLYKGSKTYNPMGHQQPLSESDAISESILIEAQFCRYPSLSQLTMLLFTSEMRSNPYPTKRSNPCYGTPIEWGLSFFWGILGALWIAMWAQASFDLPQWWSDVVYANTTDPSPVPITFQTFAILTLGTLTGFKASAMAGIFYWIFIAVGAPFAAQGNGGIDTLKYASGGYFIGFILALFALGWMAERGWDRVWWKTLGMMAIANLIIYIPGLIWLPFGIGWQYEMDMQAISDMVCSYKEGCVGIVFQWGLTPYIPGDLIKMGLAMLFCTALWQLLGNLTSNIVVYSPMEMTNVNSASIGGGETARDGDHKTE